MKKGKDAQNCMLEMTLVDKQKVVRSEDGGKDQFGRGQADSGAGLLTVSKEQQMKAYVDYLYTSA